MRTTSLTLATLLVAAVLAGCANSPPATTTTTSTPPTTTTPTTTTSPTVTPPTVTPPTVTPPVTVPTLPIVNVTAGITRVVVLSAPDRAASGNVPVCWRVEGTGKIPHTAIHWDATSRPNATAFSEYGGGAAYPNNATTADPAGYRLPGAFCTNVPVASGTVYFRAHALNPPNLPGALSEEHAIWAQAQPAAFDLLGDVPAVASPGTNVTVCWQLDQRVPHTAIHWDSKSHPNSTAFADYAGGAVYPGNATSAAAAGYGPATHCAAVPVPQSGAVYFRAHKLDPASNTDNLTGEKVIVAASPVSVVFVGERATDGTTLVCWRVETIGGNATVPHTAIHFDAASHPNATAFTEYAGGAVYPANATAAAAGGYTLPGPFCANLKVTSGAQYFRAHVLVPSARDELSAEASIRAS